MPPDTPTASAQARVEDPKNSLNAAEGQLTGRRDGDAITLSGAVEIQEGGDLGSKAE